jgi:hypothetical protein
VPPILFLTLRYVQRKRCTNLASRVALSPNGPNRASGASSPRSPIECVQNDFLCLWYVRCKLCTYLCTDTSTVSKRTKTRFHTTRHLRVPSGTSKTIYEPMVRSVQTMHISCVKISTISKRTEQSSTRPSSPRCTIRCV